MYECGSTLKGLNEVGLQRILKKRRHSTNRLEVACGYGLFIVGVSNYDLGKSLFEVRNRGCKAEYRHDFRCNGNVVAVLSGNTVYSAAEAVGDEAELTVIHINATLPSNSTGVDIKSITLIDMIIKHCSQQVISRADGVEVACKVKVNILHRNYLCVSAACRAALNAENGAKRRLAESNYNVLTDLTETVCKTDGGGSLTLARRGGGDCSYENKLTVFSFALVEKRVVNFRLVISVLLKIFFIHTRGRSDLADVFHGCGLCDFNVG